MHRTCKEEDIIMT